MNFKYIKSLIWSLFIGSTLGITGCNGLEGDNSDFNFDGKTDAESMARLPDTWRLATYNVHRCSPAGSQVANYDLTAKAISLIEADVIALNEIDKNTRTYPADQLAELSSRTGLNAIFGKAIDSDGGEYGIAILTSLQPEFTYTGALPGVEPRAFLVCEFEDFVYIATHLCVEREDYRAMSYDIIDQYVASHYSDSSKPIFLAGDLNSDYLPEAATAKWEAISSFLPTFYSFSSCLDYILRWKGNNTNVSVVRSFIPKVDGFSFYNVSDHLPIFVDIDK